MKKLFKYLLFGGTFLIYGSCAQFGTPLGGPQDKEPPYIIKELSEENFQTNFSKKTFELHFNEWIQVSNPLKEVIVSPPTSYPVKVSARGKAVKFEFSEKELLRSDATYQINFGDAIRDFTESNVYKNFVFVFSTGNVIDSLSVSGTIYDAVTDKPRGEIVVCLYEELTDSCFLKKRPFYFTKTDASGKYKLNNIKSDTFQVFALKDENVNYYFDLTSEEGGFYDKLLVLKDSSLINIDLKIFDEEDSPRLVELKQAMTGLIKAFFNPKASSVNIAAIGDSSVRLHHEFIKDSLYIWHNSIATDSILLSFKYGSQLDTIKLKKAKQNITTRPLRLDATIKKAISFHQDDSLKILFNRPLANVESSKIILKDTSNSFRVKQAIVSGRHLILLADSLMHSRDYKLEILPQGIKDFYSILNVDTLRVGLKTYNPEDFGNIDLNIINDQDTNYILHVMLGSSIIKESYIQDNKVLQLKKLIKGKYTIRLTEDIDRNNKWTSGKVINKRMPERIKEISLEELKAGWDLELDIIIKDIFNGIESK